MEPLAQCMGATGTLGVRDEWDELDERRLIAFDRISTWSPEKRTSYFIFQVKFLN